MTPSELKSLRMRSELTMTELAKRIGVSISLVSIWERGKAPIPPDRLDAVKKACGHIDSQDTTYRDKDEESFRWGTYEANSIKPDGSQSRAYPMVELGPETMRAIKDLIEAAVRQLRMMPISPDVLKAEKEGDRYRAKTQEILGRGL